MTCHTRATHRRTPGLHPPNSRPGLRVCAPHRKKNRNLALQFPRLRIMILKRRSKRCVSPYPGRSTHGRSFCWVQSRVGHNRYGSAFGWTGLPVHYEAFGGAISFLVSRERPRSLDPTERDEEPFFSFVWVDDHILLEVDQGNRLELAEIALRTSMIAILGPNSINEKRFFRGRHISSRLVYHRIHSIERYQYHQTRHRKRSCESQRPSHRRLCLGAN